MNIRSLAAVAVLTFATTVTVADENTGVGIVWYGTWQGGLREAERSGKPILLFSATPHCRGISGMW
jgi:hypothetical protein